MTPSMRKKKDARWKNILQLNKVYWNTVNTELIWNPSMWTKEEIQAQVKEILECWGCAM
jgi:hypothetical protein|tara:strand:- start:44 stop:220 length:177 start_codon:yes stop_codon:yes gene_type:complete